MTAPIVTPTTPTTTPDVAVESESYTLTTERTFNPDADIWRLLASLRETRFTGTLQISVHCGGVRKISLLSTEKVRT
jgi:hypothetical protein